MSEVSGAAYVLPLTTFHFTLVANIKRDPFEQFVLPGGAGDKSSTSLGGSLGSPSTAFLYDWNLLPIGQQLWEMHLATYATFPPMQAPETYNLSCILDQMKKTSHASD
jgi:hypothetical protein